MNESMNDNNWMIEWINIVRIIEWAKWLNTWLNHRRMNESITFMVLFHTITKFWVVQNGNDNNNQTHKDQHQLCIVTSYYYINASANKKLEESFQKKLRKY